MHLKFISYKKPVAVNIGWFGTERWLLLLLLLLVWFVFDRCFFKSLVERFVVAPEVARTLFDAVFSLLPLVVDVVLLWARDCVLGLGRVLFEGEDFFGDGGGILEVFGIGGKQCAGNGGFAWAGEWLSDAENEEKKS